MDTATRNGGRGGHAGSIELYGHVRPAVWQAVWIIFETMLGPVRVWPQARWPATCPAPSEGVSQPRVLVQVVVHGYHHK